MYIVPLKSKKVNIFSQKGVDKLDFVCYTIQAIKSGHKRGVVNFRRGGEIGRRPGLKIPWCESTVRVRFPFPAPHLITGYRGVEQPGSSSGS